MCVSLNSETPSQAPKSGTAKPNSDCGKSVKASINSPPTDGGDVVSLMRTWERGGPIRISTSNMPAAQECPHLVMQMQKDDHTSI